MMTSKHDSPISFSRWLKQLRGRHDLTQEALAELAFCSVQTIRFFETGKRRPALEMAERLVAVLQVPPSEREAFIRLARQPLPSEAVETLPSVTAGGSVPAPTAALVFQPRPLPLPSLPLIGRAAEVNVLRQLLLHDQGRLVTVLGVGGMGKTRLALAAAAALASAFRDGVAFVALAPLQAAHQLPIALADALGLPLQGTRDSQAQVMVHLGTRQLLLVLDNMEHLLNDEPGETTRWVMDLLQQAPALQVLVTSRERLRLRGERIFELGGLALPYDNVAPPVVPPVADAVLLFVARAQQADSTFQLDEQNRAAIQRICRLMEGMPLAIELAAAWVRILTCQEIADEIQRSIDFLVLADRDMPPRHRSMRAVFEHSWSLLTAAEQQVLAELAVFRGGCTRAAASAVASATLSLLAALIDKSLVRRVGEQTGQARYELHELTRQYAAQQLAADPAHEQTVQTRHCDFYASFVHTQAANLAGPQQLAALAQIEQELDNIRSAWHFALQQGFIPALRQMVNGIGEAFYWRSRYHEGVRLLRSAIEQLRTTDAVTTDPALSLFRCELDTWLATFLTQVGEVATVAARFTDILARLATLPATDRAVRACQALALHEFAYFHITTTGNYHYAYELQLASIAHYVALDNQHALIRAMARQSRMLHFFGRYAEAIAVAQAAIEIGQRQGDQLVTVSAIESIALSLTYLGRFQEAEAHFQTALARAETLRQPGRISGVLTNLGVVLILMGRFQAGQAAWQRALAISEGVSDLNYTIHSTILLGFAFLHQGDYAEADRYAQRGIAQTSETSYIRDAALGYLLLGSVQLAQGELTTAEQSLLRSIRLYQTIVHPDELGWAQAILVYVWHAQAAPTTMAAAETALTTVRQAQGFNAVSTLLPILALLLFEQGEMQLASEIMTALRPNLFVQESHWFAQVIGPLLVPYVMQPAEQRNGGTVNLRQPAELLERVAAYLHNNPANGAPCGKN
ncbi:MAG: tetratricopeptide repeat protein [Caldilineaceae bacterium]|nr:tetratricopeptide repeat protein [Caldilineaceae bacterium]